MTMLRVDRPSSMGQACCLFCPPLPPWVHSYIPTTPRGFLYLLSDLRCMSPMLSVASNPNRKAALVQDKQVSRTSVRCCRSYQGLILFSKCFSLNLCFSHCRSVNQESADQRQSSANPQGPECSFAKECWSSLGCAMLRSSPILLGLALILSLFLGEK